jgi:hypothetical protein
MVSCYVTKKKRNNCGVFVSLVVADFFYVFQPVVFLNVGFPIAEEIVVF